ncbi:MAG: quinone-interacting membrane-bound oxidoreductase complex subunit QmoC [Nitrospirota bacterium]
MSEQVISPDLNFVKEVIASGGESLKKCFQCATCSVVCNVTPDDNPFPRKEMMLAQWGQKDKLFGNPDIWLCHQCSDCTAYCPRGAKPGEVLGAIRKLSLAHYSRPSFLAKMVGSPKFFLMLFAVPLLLYLIILSAIGHLDFSKPYLNDRGVMSYSAFLDPTYFIDPVFIAAALFALVIFAKGVSNCWKDMSGHAGKPNVNIGSALFATIKEILAHKRFKKCTVTKARSTSHLLVFYAFIGLAVTTTMALIYLYGYKIFGIQAMPFLNFGQSPYPLTDPMKIIGNISALALLAGVVLMIMNRMANSAKAGAGSYYDWLFIGVVFGIMATGILSEVLREAAVPSMAYPMYLLHLSFVFFLFAYAPFSKMAHMVYRATAMVFARATNREGGIGNEN